MLKFPQWRVGACDQLILDIWPPICPVSRSRPRGCGLARGGQFVDMFSHVFLTCLVGRTPDPDSVSSASCPLLSPGIACVEKLALMVSILNTAHSVSLKEGPWKQTRQKLSPETDIFAPRETV